MMAAIVLDEEMSVSHRRQRDARKPALQILALVAEFMRRVDADAVDHADAEDEAGEGNPTCRRLHRQPRSVDRHGILNRNVGIDDPAIVTVAFQIDDGGVRRVGLVSADQKIEKRHDQIDDDRRAPGTENRAVDMEIDQTDQYEKRKGRAEQPPIAFAVGPRSGHGRGGHWHLSIISPLFNGTFYSD